MTPHTLACIVVASAARRAAVWERVVPSVLSEGFDEVVVVGDWAEPIAHDRLRYIQAPAITHSTRDALLKRDIGTLATTASTLVYLCDDHALGSHFGAELRTTLDESWDVLVPNRFTERVNILMRLNNGERHGYCGGHAGVFRRWVPERTPWLSYVADPQWRIWDVKSSLYQQFVDHARFVWSPRAMIAVEDLNPYDPLHRLDA